MNTEAGSTNEQQVNSESKGRKAFIVILSFFIFTLLSMKSTMAFFSDQRQSTNNVFQATAVFASPTPTATPTPTPVQHLVVSEILIDPSEDQQISGQGGASRGEFVEIHNPTAVAVDLSDWHIFDGSGQENLTGSLPAGGFLIITGATEAEFRAAWSPISEVPSGVLFHTVNDGTILDGLSSGGGTIYLRVVFPTIDSLSWGSNTAGFVSGCPFGFCPSPNIGSSLGRLPINQDTDSAHDFVINNPPNPGQ